MNDQELVTVRRDCPVQTPFEQGEGLKCRKGLEWLDAVETEHGLRPNPSTNSPCTLDRQVEIGKRVRANDLVRRIVDANACVYHLERGSDRGNDRTDADPQT